MKCVACGNECTECCKYCASCGVFSPWASMFINPDSLKKWNAEVSEKKKAFQTNSQKQYILKKSVINNFDFYLDALPGSVNNPIGLNIFQNSADNDRKWFRVQSEKWNNVKINDQLTINLVLYSADVSEGDLFFTIVNRQPLYFVVHLRNKRELKQSSQQGSQKYRTSGNYPIETNLARNGASITKSEINKSIIATPITSSHINHQTEAENELNLTDSNQLAPNKSDHVKAVKCLVLGIVSLVFLFVLLIDFVYLYDNNDLLPLSQLGILFDSSKWNNVYVCVSNLFVLLSGTLSILFSIISRLYVVKCELKGLNEAMFTASKILSKVSIVLSPTMILIIIAVSIL